MLESVLIVKNKTDDTIITSERVSIPDVLMDHSEYHGGRVHIEHYSSVEEGVATDQPCY